MNVGLHSASGAISREHAAGLHRILALSMLMRGRTLVLRRCLGRSERFENSSMTASGIGLSPVGRLAGDRGRADSSFVRFAGQRGPHVLVRDALFHFGVLGQGVAVGVGQVVWVLAEAAGPQPPGLGRR